MWAPAGLTASIATPPGITLTGPRTQNPQKKEAYSCGSLDANFHLGHLSLYPLLKGVLCRDQQGGHSPHDPDLPASYSSFFLPLHLVPCLASVLVAHHVLFSVPVCLHFPASTVFSRRGRQSNAVTSPKQSWHRYAVFSPHSTSLLLPFTYPTMIC